MADLRANFYKANLARADLRGADLTGANLMEANLEGANMLNAKLSCVRMARAKINGAVDPHGRRMAECKCLSRTNAPGGSCGAKAFCLAGSHTSPKR